jgi:hypothetical protein
MDCDYSLLNHKRNVGIMRELHISQITHFIKHVRRNMKENVERMRSNKIGRNVKIPSQRKKILRKTLKKMNILLCIIRLLFNLV